MMSGLMSDPNENFQPEDDGSLQFWMWCEEQSELHAEPTEPELELEDELQIEIIPEDPPF